nr:MAG TPA: hypothetical protein [Caudoviricetes sp.]
MGFYSAFQMMPKTRKNRTVKPLLAIQCGFLDGDPSGNRSMEKTA